MKLESVQFLVLFLYKPNLNRKFSQIEPLERNAKESATSKKKSEGCSIYCFFSHLSNLFFFVSSIRNPFFFFFHFGPLFLSFPGGGRFIVLTSPKGPTSTLCSMDRMEPQKHRFVRYGAQQRGVQFLLPTQDRPEVSCLVCSKTIKGCGNYFLAQSCRNPADEVKINMNV